ncbi:hypothetical protein P154DRAFT_524496 [Amniculicola lignicola CBS 123094]|uniref:Uncharacterized protein n=1 Tax=Amniculicola lignicola CBS 123094 TaxID=1392246 RepID=A0A6A5W985_9PLEO|nr:hypothetical protein P154DRAFT_524496 [Amniculicola lignicola CBS 123094]
MAKKAAKATAPAKGAAKRTAQESATPARHSKRSRPAAKTYVEQDSDEEVEDQTISSEDEAGNAKESDYENEDNKDPSSESDHEEASSEEDEGKRTKTPTGSGGKQSVVPLRKKQANEKELWKQGAKLEPGVQLIIKKPKAREAGNVQYADDTIHPNTMLFLKELAGNNDRQWLKMHDPDYRQSLQDFTTFLEKLTEKVVEIDDTIPELPVKDIIFRIYRDIRFSKDPTPYKTHFSAAWSRTGRKGPYAAYYVQVQPGGESFVGGGIWQPDAQSLSRLRSDIDRKPHKIKHVLVSKGIRKAFLGGVSDDKTKAVEAFTNLSMNKSTALKKHPKGYDADHSDIELLRLRNFTLGTKLPDEEVVGAKGLARIAELVACMLPFVSRSF